MHKTSLIKRLKEKTEPDVLDAWVKNQRLSRMSLPFGDQINQSEKSEILEIIRNTNTKNIKNINSNIIFNNNEKKN